MEINIRSLTLRNLLSAFIAHDHYENVTARCQGPWAAPRTEQSEQIHVLGELTWNLQSAGRVATPSLVHINRHILCVRHSRRTNTLSVRFSRSTTSIS